MFLAPELFTRATRSQFFMISLLLRSNLLLKNSLLYHSLYDLPAVRNRMLKRLRPSPNLRYAKALVCKFGLKVGMSHPQTL